MQLVLDANPLISVLINPGKPIGIFFLDQVELYAPELLFDELHRNIEVIVQKSSLSSQEIQSFIQILRKRVNIIPEYEFLKHKEYALLICPDPKDVPYFALCLYLKCPLWSNEKKLKEQDTILVYATHELIELFNLPKHINTCGD